MIGDLTLTCTTLIEIFAIHTIRNPYTVASTCVSSSDVFLGAPKARNSLRAFWPPSGQI